MIWHLVADIGGTHARFASYTQEGLCEIEVYPTSSDLPDMLAEFTNRKGPPKRAVMAFGCPIRDGVAKLTNADAELSVDQVKARVSCDQVDFINDFEAAAWSVAQIDANDVIALQGPEMPPHGTRVVLGPGTGLGLGILCQSGGQYQAIAGEGGHVTLSPAFQADVPVFERLVKLWPQAAYTQSGLAVEAEALLSGTGLPFLDAAVRAAHVLRSTAEICALPDADAATSIAMFRHYLGQLAGDHAMTSMAKGGVFLTGGVLQRNPWILDDQFLEAFRAQGRYRALRASIPVYRLLPENFGLQGAVNLLRYTDTNHPIFSVSKKD